MSKLKILSVVLALCMLLSACTMGEPSSSQPVAIINSESSVEPPAQPENLFDDITQAMAGKAMQALIDKYNNIIVEEEESTLGLERLDAFYKSFTETKDGDEIYIVRYADPVPVIYWLKYTAGHSQYTLIISEGGEQIQELELTEITKTDNEYVFVADPGFQKRSVEVGLRGRKELSYNNRCTHTEQEHSIDTQLINLVGAEAFEKWLGENESRTECKISIYTFLKDFAISHQSLTKALGEGGNEFYPMDEIVKQVYPEQLQSKPTGEAGNQPDKAKTEESPKPETAVVSVTGDNFLGSVESDIIDEINAERRSLGLGELQFDSKLKAASRIRSRELNQSGVWGHVRPNGDSWVTVLEKEVPVDFSSAGENLATVAFNDPGLSPHTDASWWFEEWKKSPPHYEAICKPEFTHIGAGVYYEERDDGTIIAHATTIFVQY